MTENHLQFTLKAGTGEGLPLAKLTNWKGKVEMMKARTGAPDLPRSPLTPGCQPYSFILNMLLIPICSFSQCIHQDGGNAFLPAQVRQVLGQDSDWSDSDHVTTLGPITKAGPWDIAVGATGVLCSSLRQDRAKAGPHHFTSIQGRSPSSHYKQKSVASCYSSKYKERP